MAARASRFHQSSDDDFLRADELLFLVLHLVKRAMHDTVTGGSLDLRSERAARQRVGRGARALWRRDGERPQ